MSNAAALEVLERRLDDYERKANALLAVVNDMRAEDGLPPRPPFGGGSGASHDGSTITASRRLAQIRSDTFYGKKLQTAVREYLEMRGPKDLGPAKPREIYEAITAGGFKFDTKDENVALVGLRALLRKRSAFFHKLPNGAYGLTAWYPDAKRQKMAAPEGEDDKDTAEEAGKAATAADKATAA